MARRDDHLDDFEVRRRGVAGVLSSERYNAEVEAVCDGVRRQLNEKFAEIS